MRYALLLLLAGCPPIPPQADDPKPGDPTCATACEHLTELECPLAEPTANGKTCVDICENTLTGPDAAHWPVACLTEAKTCEACDEE